MVTICNPASNFAKMAKEDPWADADLLPWLAPVAAALRPGTVLACTALRRSYRDLLRDSAPAPVVLTHLSGQRATLLKRMADIIWPGQGLHRSRGQLCRLLQGVEHKACVRCLASPPADDPACTGVKDETRNPFRWRNR